MKNVFMFTVATNFYDFKYGECINSHRKYAKKYNYKYMLINKLPWVAGWQVNTWLRISMIIALLNKYDRIFYLDSDCEINPNTPQIEDVFEEGKSLYMVNGYSGRVNSGMLIIRSDVIMKDFFVNLLNNYNKVLPKEDVVTAKGENGHFIHFTKNLRELKVLDNKWNNTYDQNLDDYIRHYTGPMMKEFGTNPKNQLRIRVFNYINWFYKKIAKKGFLKKEPEGLDLKKKLKIIVDGLII